MLGMQPSSPVLTVNAVTPAEACPGNGGAGSFRGNDRLVMTYLYYWYDAASLDEPALALRPPTGQPLDWRDQAWHRRQLTDMAEAGIDVALAVYWGDRPTWSTTGLETLVAARQALVDEGAEAPAIGLFLDTNLFAEHVSNDATLADWTREPGRQLLAEQITGFFDRVPPCHRALIDGRPLAFIWRPDTEDDHRLRFDEDTFPWLYARLEERLGSRPYIVRERTWDVRAERSDMTLETDDVFEWGAALNGPRFQGRTVALGPGYDDLRLEGRPGYHRDRDDGKTYARDLRTAVLSGSPWVLLETWNELWEGTAIAETEEYGRTYLDITRRYVRLFHQLGNDHPRDGVVDLGNRRADYLGWLTHAWQDLGTWAIADRRPGAVPLPEPQEGVGYFHFVLPLRLKAAEAGPVEVIVEYFDDGEGSFLVEYDSDDPGVARGGRFKQTAPVLFEGTGTWRSHAFVLPDPRFARGQYGGYGDFRIRDVALRGGSGHVFGRVILRTAPALRPVLLEPATLTVLEAASPERVDLHWHEVDGAAGYVVAMGPVGVEATSAHGYSGESRSRCGTGEGWPWEWHAEAVAVGPTCRLGKPASAPPGLYRWRVTGVDAAGAPLGEPSNWGYLLAED